MSRRPTASGAGPDDDQAPVTPSWLLTRLGAAIRDDPALRDAGLRALPGLAAGPALARAPLRAYWGVNCECRTSAVLSVEVGPERTRGDVAAALPALLDGLRLQANGFRGMSCEAHARLRSGQFESGPGPPG